MDNARQWMLVLCFTGLILSGCNTTSSHSTSGNLYSVNLNGWAALAEEQPANWQPHTKPPRSTGNATPKPQPTTDGLTSTTQPKHSQIVLVESPPPAKVRPAAKIAEQPIVTSEQPATTPTDQTKPSHFAQTNKLKHYWQILHFWKHPQPNADTHTTKHSATQLASAAETIANAVPSTSVSDASSPIPEVSNSAPLNITVQSSSSSQHDTIPQTNTVAQNQHTRPPAKLEQTRPAAINSNDAPKAKQFMKHQSLALHSDNPTPTANRQLATPPNTTPSKSSNSTPVVQQRTVRVTAESIIIGEKNSSQPNRYYRLSESNNFIQNHGVNLQGFNQSTRGHWKLANYGSLPTNAFLAGFQDNQQFYICHARHQGNLVPGKFANGRCHLVYDGREIETDEYSILVGEDYRWIASNDHSTPPAKAILGGDVQDEPLYICAAYYNSGQYPGTLVNGHCIFAFDGDVIRVANYGVLTQA
ncbi:MAG: hypothetical protein Tsb005_05430 [Gammaproteobacteria bacterium]